MGFHFLRAGASVEADGVAVSADAVGTGSGVDVGVADFGCHFLRSGFAVGASSGDTDSGALGAGGSIGTISTVEGWALLCTG